MMGTQNESKDSLREAGRHGVTALQENQGGPQTAEYVSQNRKDIEQGPQSPPASPGKEQQKYSINQPVLKETALEVNQGGPQIAEYVTQIRNDIVSSSQSQPVTQKNVEQIYSPNQLALEVKKSSPEIAKNVAEIESNIEPCLRSPSETPTDVEQIFSPKQLAVEVNKSSPEVANFFAQVGKDIEPGLGSPPVTQANVEQIFSPNQLAVDVNQGSPPIAENFSQIDNNIAPDLRSPSVPQANVEQIFSPKHLAVEVNQSSPEVAKTFAQVEKDIEPDLGSPSVNPANFQHIFSPTQLCSEVTALEVIQSSPEVAEIFAQVGKDIEPGLGSLYVTLENVEQIFSPNQLAVEVNQSSPEVANIFIKVRKDIEQDLGSPSANLANVEQIFSPIQLSSEVTALEVNQGSHQIAKNFAHIDSNIDPSIRSPSVPPANVEQTFSPIQLASEVTALEVIQSSPEVGEIFAQVGKGIEQGLGSLSANPANVEQIFSPNQLAVEVNQSSPEGANIFIQVRKDIEPGLGSPSGNPANFEQIFSPNQLASEVTALEVNQSSPVVANIFAHVGKYIEPGLGSPSVTLENVEQTYLPNQLAVEVTQSSPEVANIFAQVGKLIERGLGSPPAIPANFEQTFSPNQLASGLTGLGVNQSDPHIADYVAKEGIEVESDPQYLFPANVLQTYANNYHGLEDYPHLLPAHQVCETDPLALDAYHSSLKTLEVLQGDQQTLEVLLGEHQNVDPQNGIENIPEKAAQVSNNLALRDSYPRDRYNLHRPKPPPSPLKHAIETLQKFYDDHGPSMGLDLIARIRNILGGWQKPKEDSSPSSGNEAATQRENRTKPQHLSNFVRRKRGNNESAPALTKYRKIEGFGQSSRLNVAAAAAAENHTKGYRTNMPNERKRGERRLSIFNPPQTVQYRLLPPDLNSPIDIADEEDEELRSFGTMSNGGLHSTPTPPSATTAPQGPSGVRTKLLYSEAVRLGQNGYGHSNGSSTAQLGRDSYHRSIASLTNHRSLLSATRSAQPEPRQQAERSLRGPTWDMLLSRDPPNRQSMPRRQHSNYFDYARLLERRPSPAPIPPPPAMHYPGYTSHASTISDSPSSSDDEREKAKNRAMPNVAKGETLTIRQKIMKTYSAVAVDNSSDEELPAKTNNQSANTTGVNRTQLNISTNSLDILLSNCKLFQPEFVDEFIEDSARRRKEIERERELARTQTEKLREARKVCENTLLQSLLNQKFFHQTASAAIEDAQIVSVKEVQPLIPFTQQHADRYNELMNGPAQQVLVSKFNMNINRSDIKTLQGSNWLNDEVINFYMNLITDRSERRAGKIPSVYAMNTFFVPRLLQNGHSGVKRWTRKVDLFSKDIIPVPVHCNGVHWCMAIIHMRDKSIRYYDSMGKKNQPVLDALVAYLEDESMDKRKQQFDTSDFIIENVSDVPQQTNGSDCGVFSCMFAEYISRDEPLVFSQDNMDYFRKKMVLEICEGELWM